MRSGRGSDPAILAPDGTVQRTFSAIEQEALYWAERLETLAPGSVVAIQAGNVPEWPALLLAAWRMGLVAVPLDGDISGERLRRLEGACGISARLQGGVIHPGESLAFHEPLVGTDLLKITSGTTSGPRAVRFTAAQLLADCDAICDTMGLREDDLNYGIVAFSHSYGFSNLITPLLCRGVPVVAAADAIPRAVVEGLAATKATVFPGVPAVFRAVAEFQPKQSPLRLCISAGAPLNADVALRFHAGWGVKIHSFYGASECGGICYDRGEVTAPAQGYVGPLLEGVTLRPFADSSPSLMRVESAAVGQGYHGDDDGALHDGGFEPSDLLEWNGEGYIIRGRISDIINVAGRKVNPAEIERVLRDAPGVRDVVVLGLPAAARGEDVAACVVGEIKESALRTYAAHHLPAWQVPKRWFFRDEIPVTARGKISRAEIRRLIEVE